MKAALAKKLKISDTFMDLVACAPLNKRVSVVEIADAAGIDRKTFYNYFRNIDDLTVWIVRYYLKNLLEGSRFKECALVYPHQELHDDYEDWPFYVRVASNDHCLLHGDYFKAVAYHFEEYRDYYSNMFHGMGCGYFNLLKYLEWLYLPALKDDVRYLLNGREMPDGAVDFLAEYHVVGIFARLPYHFTSANRSTMVKEVEPFWNYSLTTMKRTIDGMFEQLVEHVSEDGIEREVVRDVYTGRL